MSRRSVVTVLTAALLLGVCAGSASAADPYEPVFKTERVYAHCGDNPKVQSELFLEAGLDVQPYPWNTTPPIGSQTSGAGCLSHDEGLYVGDTMRFKGTHTGNLDQLTVHASVMRPFYPRHGVAGAAFLIAVHVRVTVDGTTHSFYESLKTVGGLNGGLGGVRIPPDGDLASELDFSVVGLGLLDNDEAGTHDVLIALDYLVGAHEWDQAVVWAVDTTDWPSGVTFSPATLAEQVLAVTP